MKDYSRHYNPTQPFHYTKHSTHFHVDTKAVLLGFILLLAVGFIVLKVVTWDGCRAYYNYECLAK